MKVNMSNIEIMSLLFTFGEKDFQVPGVFPWKYKNLKGLSSRERTSVIGEISCCWFWKIISQICFTGFDKLSYDVLYVHYWDNNRYNLATWQGGIGQPSNQTENIFRSLSPPPPPPHEKIAEGLQISPAYGKRM
jgi:hypothetical protein